MSDLPTRKLWWWVATWFGSGLSPKAPGTAGSFAALPFAFFIQYYFGNAALFYSAMAIFIAGCFASNQYMKYYPGKHDPKQIVVDEVSGMWLVISVIVSHPDDYSTMPILYLLSFALFRFFDAVKPWPISFIDRKIKGGFGVMVDDIAAAVASIIFYLIVLAFYMKFFWSGI